MGSVRPHLAVVLQVGSARGGSEAGGVRAGGEGPSVAAFGFRAWEPVGSAILL